MSAKMKVADLGELIDSVWEMRQKRLTAQREVDKLEEEEKTARAEIGVLLRVGKLEGGKGKLATAAFRRTTVAQVVDEEAFLKWAMKKANRDCLKVGVIGEAWRLRLAEGDAAPGVDKFTKEEVVLSKAGG